MKKATWLSGLTIALFLFVSSVSVFAGEINSAEAGVISYCSGTFEYRGKQYKATSAALGALRAKLASDGVDLTSAQATKAKSMVTSYMATGIASGYMVEVKPGDSVEPSKAPEPDDTAKPSKAPTTTEVPATTEAPAATETPATKAPDAPKDIKKPTIQKEPTIAGDYDAYYMKEEELTGSTDKLPVTSEKYISSELTVMDGETIIYNANLPIKNTGYNLNSVWIIAVGLIVILGGTIMIACINIFFARKHEKK